MQIAMCRYCSLAMLDLISTFGYPKEVLCHMLLYVVIHSYF